jgi:hypothetical protein
MALRPSDLRSWIAEHGPYAYHETGLDNIDSILQQGIQSGDDYQDMGLEDREAAAQSTLVIYDFHGDKIILGTYSQAQNTAGGRIIGTYDGDDVVLYRNQEWLNPSYFRRLWHESFPTKPLRKVRVR